LWPLLARQAGSAWLGQATGQSELGRESDGGHVPDSNMNSFFFFPGYFKSVSNFQIHIKFNSCPKFMKLVPLFF
jgi:hypothetical protein